MIPFSLEALLQDVKTALRACMRRPALSVIIVLTLATGMGVVTAVFSVVNAVLLRPLAYRNPDRLMVLWEDGSRRGGSAKTNVASSNFLDWRDQVRTFDALAIVRNVTLTLTSLREPYSPLVHRVSANYFDVLGTPPLMGRTFVKGEDIGQPAPVVVLSYGLWQSHFGGDPNVVGRSLLLDDVAHTIVGVMRREFYSVNFFPSQPELWVPLSLDQIGLERNIRRFLVVGRLKDRVTPSEARADLNTIAAGLATKYPETNTDWGINAMPIREQVVGDFRRPVVLLLLAAGLVLMIAAFNVANLLLAQGADRARDIAIRLTLGGPAIRIFRQLLIESLVLAIAGGILALVLAALVAQPLVSLVPKGAGVPFLDSVSIDGRVAAFALALGTLTGLLFGLAPSRQAFTADLQRTLRQNGRSAAGGVLDHRLRQALVIAEIALSVALVMGASLLVRTFDNLRKFEPGFKAQNVVSMTTALRGANYQQPSQRAEFFRSLTADAAQLPGVTAVSAVSSLPPIDNFASIRFTRAGEASAPGNEPYAVAVKVSPAYFTTMGIPVIEGRANDDRDRATAPPVVLVSQALARRWFPGENPVGRLLRIDGQNAPRQIVGVVGDVMSAGVDPTPQPVVYIPYEQGITPEMTLVIRAAGDIGGVTRAARRLVLAKDRTLPVFDVRTLEAVLNESRWVSRFTMTLLGIFAALSLSLVAAGTYAVLSFIVSQRRQEIGLRIALGATHGSVLRMVLGRGAGTRVGRLDRRHLDLRVGTTDPVDVPLRRELVRPPHLHQRRHGHVRHHAARVLRAGACGDARQPGHDAARAIAAMTARTPREAVTRVPVASFHAAALGRCGGSHPEPLRAHRSRRRAQTGMGRRGDRGRHARMGRRVASARRWTDSRRRR